MTLFLHLNKYLYNNIFSFRYRLGKYFNNNSFLLLLFFSWFNLSINSGPFFFIFNFVILLNKLFNFGTSLFSTDFHLFKLFFNNSFLLLWSLFLKIAFNNKFLAKFCEFFKIFISLIILSNFVMFFHISKYFCKLFGLFMFLYLSYNVRINLLFNGCNAFSISTLFFQVLNANLKLLLSIKFFLRIIFFKFLYINFGFLVRSSLSKNSLPYLFTYTFLNKSLKLMISFKFFNVLKISGSCSCFGSIIFSSFSGSVFFLHKFILLCNNFFSLFFIIISNIFTNNFIADSFVLKVFAFHKSKYFFNIFLLSFSLLYIKDIIFSFLSERNL